MTAPWDSKKRNVLISLMEDQSVMGVLTRHDSLGIELENSKVSYEGTYRDVPEPGKLWVPIGRVVMLQYLPDDYLTPVPKPEQDEPPTIGAQFSAS